MKGEVISGRDDRFQVFVGEEFLALLATALLCAYKLDAS